MRLRSVGNDEREQTLNQVGAMAGAWGQDSAEEGRRAGGQDKFG